MPARLPHVLVVAANLALREPLAHACAALHLDLEWAASVAEMLGLAARQPIDLVIIDDTPSWHGSADPLHPIRQLPAAPVVVLTETDADHLSFFQLGADDCLTKPFQADILAARVQAVLRRSNQRETTSSHDVIQSGELEIVLPSHQVFVNGHEIRLTRIEWALLEQLVRNTGHILPHRTLLQHIWGDHYGDEDEYLRVYIGRLRKKLGDDPSNPHYIFTERDIGYRFLSPPRPHGALPHAHASPALVASGHVVANLPVQLTPLVGREQEIIDICALLRRNEVRLLTLTGSGGIGKTRLGIQVAHELQDTFASGVCFVALASLRDPGLVAATIGQALGLQETGDMTWAEYLQQVLRDRHLLLVLDNFEQVLDAASLIAELLSATAQLKILITSRAALHIYGEQEFTVQSLTVPDLRAHPSFETLVQSPAVALFAQRAQAVAPRFTLTEENVSYIAEICVRLDGLPLALELAAARSKVFAPQALLARLVGQSPDQLALQFLADGAHNRPLRHQTLDAAIDWSCDLLDDAERTLFVRLGAFVGGCTLPAIEHICNGEEDFSIDVFDGLLSLVDKSLVQHTICGVDHMPRFSMLETIRAYALDRLLQQADAETIFHQHAGYYLALAEEAVQEITKSRCSTWINRLVLEHDNLRAALQRYVTQREAALAVQLSGVLWPFWLANNYLSEGRHWLELALALEDSSSSPDRLRARALQGAGVLATALGDWGKARPALEQAALMWRQLGEQQGLAESLNKLGHALTHQGEYHQAVQTLEEGLAIQRSLGNAEGVADALQYLGVAMRYTAQYTEALALLEESLTLYKQQGNTLGSAWVRNHMASVVIDQPDLPRARQLCEESLAVLSQPDQTGTATLCCRAFSLLLLGLIAFYAGKIDRAVALQQESLTLHREAGYKNGIAWNLLVLSGLAGIRGDGLRAARLYGATSVLRESIAFTIGPRVQAELDRHLAAIRGSMEAVLWVAGTNEGRAMTIDAAIGYALAA